ncbi:hypothetical protein [Streptomyces purpureus]|uniref:hypothetical protein n=1 Tax=Streptomyces purpureus TaxID=1951 RepID=UPI00035D8EFA|nr:hypothetical protein [Streptomyces purpureus]
MIITARGADRNPDLKHGLTHPWLITVGAVVLLAGTGYALRCRVRRRRGAETENCCPAAEAEPRPNEHVDVADPGGEVR